MPLQDTFKGLEKFMVGQILNICHVFFDNDVSCQLRDQKKFLGPIGWAKLDEEDIRKLMLTIGITDIDLLPGFKSPITSFPAALATNTSETQRKEMVLKARPYTVTECMEDAGVYFVRKSGSDTRTIDTTKLPILCACKMASKNKQTVCVHIVAVAVKHPQAEILKRIEMYINNETAHQRKQRLTGADDASKVGHPRRTGNNKSRNPGKHVQKTTDMIRLDSDLLSNSSTSTLTGGRKRLASESSSNATMKSSQIYGIQEPVSQNRKIEKKKATAKKVIHPSQNSSVITLDDSPPIHSAPKRDRLPKVPERSSSNTYAYSNNPRVPPPPPIPGPSRPRAHHVLIPRPAQLPRPLLNVSLLSSNNGSAPTKASATVTNEKVREVVDILIKMVPIYLI
uniref:SWIM-type domain-containing protein n=1 Tax=Panagrolaimus davidi TaxID=227884 RepID=A0A914QGH4_9BILA